MRRVRHAPAIAGVTLLAIGTLGCPFGFADIDQERDVDRSPVVNTGAGATIIYPGQAGPPHPGNLHPREAGYGQGAGTYPGAQPAPGTGAPPSYGASTLPPDTVASGAAVPPPEYTSSGGRSSSGGGGGGRGSNIMLLGGAETEETSHVKVAEEPMWMKYLALPFAVVAAPFKYGAEKIRGEPEPGPAVPRLENQPRPQYSPAPPPTDYETAQLQGMERELDQRAGEPASGTAPPPPAPSYGAAGGASAGGFADELAALRQRTHAASAPPSPSAPLAPAPPSLHTPTPSETIPAPSGNAGQVDRDGDGRTDQWIEREDGVVVRERFDENFDGTPDRILLYDPASHDVVAIEEDADFDGRIDTWTTLRGGQVIGRRADGNGDGQVDSWSYYQNGVITRLERDANADGFRDSVAYYEGGHLAREERDDDGDGRSDLVRYFDDGERLERVEEDADGDGQIDVVSHYEDGRLMRREVLDAAVLGLGEPGNTEHN